MSKSHILILKKINIIIYIIMFSFMACSKNETPIIEIEETGVAFVTIWKTDVSSASNSNEISIPTNPDFNYNYEVDWGDGTVVPNIIGDATHTYIEPGIYTVSITGEFPAIYFNRQGSSDSLISIEQWGDIKWRTMSRAFDGCRNMDIKATDIPDLGLVRSADYMFYLCESLVANSSINDWNTSAITDMTYMFGSATIFNQYIGDWDVGAVANMRQMFDSAEAFNQDIGNWDVSSCTNMLQMFGNALVFNQDIGAWDVSAVKDMRAMFAGAVSFDQNIGLWDVSQVEDMGAMFAQTPFNQDIGLWNVGKVKNMLNMFGEASLFNQNIGSWDVSMVIDMRRMFFEAISFNQDIGNWDVSGVSSTMDNMFDGAVSFDQDLGNWDVNNVRFFRNMFNRVTLSIENYDKLLIGWNNSISDDKPTTTFDAGESQFCNAVDARMSLNAKGWTIHDGGYNCN